MHDMNELNKRRKELRRTPPTVIARTEPEPDGTHWETLMEVSGHLYCRAVRDGEIIADRVDPEKAVQLAPGRFLPVVGAEGEMRERMRELRTLDAGGLLEWG